MPRAGREDSKENLAKADLGIMFRLQRKSVEGVMGIEYAVALRAIGQDLTALLHESLEIKVEGDVFVARGRLASGFKRLGD